MSDLKKVQQHLQQASDALEAVKKTEFWTKHTGNELAAAREALAKIQGQKAEAEAGLKLIQEQGSAVMADVRQQASDVEAAAQEKLTEAEKVLREAKATKQRAEDEFYAANEARMKYERMLGDLQRKKQEITSIVG